jgi:RNA polymerase sigma-70 factor (ECF subfamily)
LAASLVPGLSRVVIGWRESAHVPILRGVDELTRMALDARRDEPGALEDFIKTIRGQVRALCAVLVDEQSADDLVQETFLRAVVSLPRFRGDASARTWVLSIARRACADEVRARSRRRRRDARLRVGRLEVGPDVAEQVGVDDLLARLDPDRQAAFALTQMLRLTYAEAAAVCGCPPGTIRSRVARAPRRPHRADRKWLVCS